MANKRFTIVLLIGLVLLGSLLIAARKPAAEYEIGQADVARWVAMGQAYVRVGADAGRLADVARWEAMGQAYAKVSTDAGRLADVARWEAMGQAYAQIEKDNQLNVKASQE